MAPTRRLRGRTLRGDKPGDLPMQQATAIKFGVNLAAAKALALDMAAAAPAGASEVVE